MTIKNIIFDLGGVILNIDFQKTTVAFKALGASNANNLFKDNKKFISEFAVGKIDAPTFRTAIKNNIQIMVTDAEFDQAWNAMLLDIPKQRLDIIYTLKHHYRCFLFSNTNVIHHQRVMQILNRDLNIESFAEFFEKEYHSYLMGFAKPNIAAYRAIINENILALNETLFIDDTLENIAGAESIGLHIMHLNEELSKTNILKTIHRIEKRL